MWPAVNTFSIAKFQGNSVSGTIILMDAETTGQETTESQILSLTMKAVDSITGKVIDKKRVRVGFRGDHAVDPENIVIHGINPLRHKGQSESQTAQEVRDFFVRHGGDSTPVLGYNPRFDMRYVRSLLTRNGHDATVVSLQKIDPMEEVVKQIYRKKFPVDGLDTRDHKYDPSRKLPVLKQASVAKALGIKVDESKTHDDDYDTDLCLEIWRRLGKPLATKPQGPNHPYELQEQFKGKIIRAKEWSMLEGGVVENDYYVVGWGAGEIDNQFGEKKFHKTMLLKASGPDYDDFVRRLAAADQAESKGLELKNGGVTWTATDAIVVQRDYASSQILDFEVIEPKPEQSIVFRKAADYGKAHVEDLRLRELVDRYQSDKFSATEPFNLKNPDSTVGFIAAQEEALIPELARDLAGLSKEERYAHISELANRQTDPRGQVWCHNMLILAERFGYRNNIAGFEDARLRDLNRLMPENVVPQGVSSETKDLPRPLANKLKEQGVHRLDVMCDGAGVVVTAFDKDGSSIFEQRVDNYPRNGKLSAPLVDDFEKIIREQFGVTKSDAGILRKGVKTFIDKSSWSYIRGRFSEMISAAETLGDQKNAELLKEVLSDMGDSYSAFASRGALIGDAETKDGTNPRQKRDMGSFKKYMDSVEDLKAELLEAYKAIDNGVPADEVEKADNITRLAMNLKRPTREIKELDAIRFRENVSLVEGGVETPSQDGEPEYVESSSGRSANGVGGKSPLGGGGVVRCKVCNREVKGKNAVAGMGPKCAQKVYDYTQRPDIAASDITNRNYKMLSEMSQASSSFPLMLVRDRRTKKTFVADILRQEEDGRYLVIDLSEVARRTSSGRYKNPLKDAARVYLESENYEVARILGRLGQKPGERVG